MISTTLTSEWMFPRNTAGHHKRAQNKKLNRESEKEILNFYGEEASSQTKVPMPTDDKNT
jgi:hypothetical protein